MYSKSLMIMVEKYNKLSVEFSKKYLDVHKICIGNTIGENDDQIE